MTSGQHIPMQARVNYLARDMPGLAMPYRATYCHI